MTETYSSTQETPPIQVGPQPRNRFLFRAKRRLLRYVWLLRAALVLGILAGLSLIIIIFGLILGRAGVPNYIVIASDFIFTPRDKIKTQSGQSNILILGKAGAGYTAPDLTDTIIFTSISEDTASAALISLPRDIWVPAIRAKLNSAYYWGGQMEEGGEI